MGTLHTPFLPERLEDIGDSSAIENIITTQDDLYQSDSFEQQYQTVAAKEVHSYAY